jgi:hypothetical protein
MSNYLHTNTEGKYLKSLIEYGVDVVSITTLTYRSWERWFIASFDVLIFAQNPNPPSIHLLEDQLITISERLCHFMMHEFILPKGRYHPNNGHMIDNATLCDWTSESQDKLHIIHQHFEHYRGVWTSVMAIYRLVYELMSLSYCYTFVWCLMKCVPECDLDWISNEMCAWILSCPAAMGVVVWLVATNGSTITTVQSSSDRSLISDSPSLRAVQYQQTASPSLLAVQ